MTTYAAHLRVYEPLAAFDGEERRRWADYVGQGGAPGRAAGVAAERAAALRALVGAPRSVVPQLGEEAFVTELDGVTLVCPWQTRMRSLEALEEFRARLAEPLAEAFVPAAAAEPLEAELQELREQGPLRPHVLSCTWQVPLVWFVLVEADERQISLGTPAPGSGRTGGTGGTTVTGRELVYRTAMSRARRRTARALAVLRRSVDDGAVTAGVEELGRWLEEFHPRSLVELDYGGLVHLLDDAELTTDESARDIAGALAALADGEPVRAAAAYSRVTARMKALQAVESAN
jgi:hypothetical protein